MFDHPSMEWLGFLRGIAKAPPGADFSEAAHNYSLCFTGIDQGPDGSAIGSLARNETHPRVAIGLPLSLRFIERNEFRSIEAHPSLCHGFGQTASLLLQRFA